MPAQIARLRVELGADPATLARHPRGELLYQALAALPAHEVRDLPGLVDGLADDADPVLRGAGLRLLRDGVRSGTIPPATARAALDTLLTGADTEVLVGTLAELAEPWAASQRTREGQLRPLLAGGPAIAGAALDVAVRHGHTGLAHDTVTDESLPGTLRQRALRDLGVLAGREVIPTVLAIAATDPLLFADAAVACLLSLHRRGLFPADADAPSIVDLALTDHGVPLDDVATVLYTCRHEALRATMTRGDVPRRLALLAALGRQAPDDLPVGDAVTGLLRTLPAGSRERVDALAVLRELRHGPAEEAVLDALVDLPGPALRTLEAIGGRRTVEVLAGDPPYLAPVRRRALELRWHLTDDPAERRALVARLNPRDLPARIAADLGAPDPLELAVLRLGFDDGDAADALLRLARTGDVDTIPVLTDLFARVVAEQDARTEENEHDRTVEKAVAAIRGLGRRLHERKRIRPVCLLDAADAAEAGMALAASVVLDLLDRSADEVEQAALLDVLRSLPGTYRLHRLLRHRDRHVRAHAIAVLAADPRAARALSASLAVLARADDAPTVRRAVAALGVAGATWAGPIVAGCLDHPSMSVKKAAAEALATTGTPAEAPALLGWLGRHDNPGLRASLRAALLAVLGNAYVATVLAAAETATDDRARDLLLAALDCAIGTPAVHALAEHGSPVARPVLAMLADGRLRLRAGDLAGLADRFAAHGIAQPDAEPTDGARLAADVAELVARGWQDAAGNRVVDAFERSPRNIDRDRPAQLRPLLPALFRLAASRPAALALGVHCGRVPWPAAETTVYVAAVRALLDSLGSVARDERDPAGLRWLESVAPHLPADERRRTAEFVRGVLIDGSPRRSALPLIRACGASPERVDLDRALAAAAKGPDPWEVEPAVLREAFDTTADEDDPIPSRRRMAKLIAAYPTTDDARRPALLTELTTLQPLGAPQWTITERAAARPEERTEKPAPRSAARRELLLKRLDTAAADELLTWPEPDVRRHVLTAYLDGRVSVADLSALTPALSTVELTTPEHYPRAARVVALMDDDERRRLLPQLLRWWQETGDDTVRGVLRTIDPDALAAAIEGVGGPPGETSRAGPADSRPGLLELLHGRRVTATPWLREAADDRITLVDGPLRRPGDLAAEVAALAALRVPTEPAGPPATRADLIAAARDGDRRALTRLAEADEDRGATGDAAAADLTALLGDLIRHPQRRMRLLAHRTARRLLDRGTYLRYTAELLTDPTPDIVRSALRALSHGGYLPAVRAAVDLLDSADPVLRRAADAALVHFGLSAAPELTHAMARARPDRRQRYADVLKRISTQATPTADRP